MATAAQGTAPGIWAGVSSPHQNPETAQAQETNEPLPAHLPPPSICFRAPSPVHSGGTSRWCDPWPANLQGGTRTQTSSPSHSAMMQASRSLHTRAPHSATNQGPETRSSCPAPPLGCPWPCPWASDSKGEGICQGSSLLCKLPEVGEPDTKAKRPLIPWQAERGAGPERRWPWPPLACLHCPCHLGGLPASHIRLPRQQDLLQPVGQEEQ